MGGRDIWFYLFLILNFAIIILFFITFYATTLKCFYRDKKQSAAKKIGLFFVLILLNPSLFSDIGYNFIEKLRVTLLTAFGSENPVSGFLVTMLVLISISLAGTTLLAFVYSYLVKSVNKGMSVFAYFMTSALFLAVNNMGALMPTDDKRLQNQVGTVLDLIVIALFWLFYRFVIASFSKLTYRRQEFNWKFFIFPPAVIIAFERGITAVGDDNAIGFYLLKQVSSILIILLTLTSFSVMIRNLIVLNKEKEARTSFKVLSVEVMEALAHTIDAKDEYTKGHSTRVAKYSRMIAEKMGLFEEECENVYYMGLLHDIGKIGVPNEIINSPNKLTDEEYMVIKTHPGIGYDILAEIKSRPDLSIGARWHHERYDGKGYPDGKVGEDAPIWARIIAVADSYDAMTSNRSYRKYMPQDAVRSEIEKNEGTQFDPEIAKHMIAIIDEDTEYVLHE